MEPEASVMPVQKKQSTAASLISGSMGGMAQVLVGQPLDTIKTRAQTAIPGQFKGPLDIATQTIKKEGFFALYKGMASPLIGIAGVNSLLFAANNYARKLVSPFPDLTIPQIMLAGSMAGVVQAVLASPVEMFKVRMQANQSTTPKRLKDVVGEMYSKYGWRQGIMRGYWITVAREIPAYAGFYAGYEWSKRSLQKSLGTNNLPVWATLTAGGIGGIGYWTACYPLDVVKSRIQFAEAPPRGANYIINAFRDIYRREGAKAFFAGLAPTYIRAVPAAASTFVAFEITMEMLQKHTNL
ncbi:uncharacterized protein JCM15063_003443 [Sporobolomyces koalae]|uniref:uncharacterized protein n=1 Tax=Sporobolomyces koalae TaxID=500713 RepID=UPI003171C46F